MRVRCGYGGLDRVPAEFGTVRLSLPHPQKRGTLELETQVAPALEEERVKGPGAWQVMATASAFHHPIERRAASRVSPPLLWGHGWEVNRAVAVMFSER